MEVSPHEQAVFADLQPSTIEMVREFQRKLDGTFEGEQRQMIEEALLLSCEVHADQALRSDGTPYVEHPLQVASNVLDALEKPDAEIVIGALLHDSVEDQAEKMAHKLQQGFIKGQEQQMAFRYINERFGSRVTKIVATLTNPDFDGALTNNGSAITTENKNRLYVQHITEAIEDPDVLPIKLFDFAENALRLHEVADASRRLHLARKYMPVVDVFVTRLQKDDHGMKQSTVNELLAQFRMAREQIQVFAS